MHWSQVHVWLNDAGAFLEGWIGVLAARTSVVIQRMRWPPTIPGWISIASWFLGALGGLLLYYVRLEAIGGWTSDQLISETKVRNQKRIPVRRLGRVLIVLGVVLQAVALFFPDASP